MISVVEQILTRRVDTIIFEVVLLRGAVEMRACDPAVDGSRRSQREDDLLRELVDVEHQPTRGDRIDFARAFGIADYAAAVRTGNAFLRELGSAMSFESTVRFLRLVGPLRVTGVI